MSLPVPSQDAPATAGHPSFFMHRAFAFLWLGQTISEFGSMITGSALQLLAVLVLGASSAQMGLLAFFSSLPILAFGLLTGVLIDRLPRRPLMIVADVSRALLLFLVPLAALAGWLHMTQLYIVTLLLSSFSFCFTIAQRSFLPSILQKEQLLEGNSKLSTSSALAEVGGPALGGLLVQLISAPFVVVIDACSYLFSAVCLLFIRERVAADVVEEPRQSFISDFLAGLHLLFSQPVLRTLARAALVRHFFGGAFAALYTLYVVRTLHISAAGYGLLVTLGGCGALVGALFARRISQRWGLARTLLGSALLDACLSFLTPLAPVALAFPCLALAQLLGDSCYVIYEIHEVSLRQALVEERMQGRLHSCMHVLVNGVGPLGALLAGWLSLEIGVRPLLWVGAAGMLLSALSLLFSPIRRL